MKVLIVYHYIAHYRLPVFSQLVKDFEDKGWEIDFFSDESSGKSKIKVLDSSIAHNYPEISDRWHIGKNFWIGSNILWQRGLIKVLRKNKYDVVIMLGNAYYLSTWVAVALNKIKKSYKIYLWTHGVRSQEYGFKKYLRIWFYKLSDHLLLYGNHARSILAGCGIDEDSISVIYNSLDFDAQRRVFDINTSCYVSDVLQKYNIPDSARIALFTGRLTKGKRVDMAIEAIGKARNAMGININLVVVGEGPEMMGLKELVAKLDLDGSIHFVGACYDEYVIAALMKASRVLIVPGDIGLSAIHALSYGVPVITHDNFSRHGPEFEIIKDGKTGSFYKYGEIESLVENLAYWINVDKSLVEETCISSVKKNYTPQAQSKLIIEAIDKRGG